MWRRWRWAAWSARAARCLWVSASITELSAARSRRQSLRRESSALRVSDDRNKCSNKPLRLLMIFREMLCWLKLQEPKEDVESQKRTEKNNQVVLRAQIDKTQHIKNQLDNPCAPFSKNAAKWENKLQEWKVFPGDTKKWCAQLRYACCCPGL